MSILNRDGRLCSFSSFRLQKSLLNSLSHLGHVDRFDEVSLIFNSIENLLYDGIHVEELLLLIIEVCMSKAHVADYYEQLAVHYFTKNMHTHHSYSFCLMFKSLVDNNIVTGDVAKFCNDVIFTDHIVRFALDSCIILQNDNLLTYFGLQTLQSSYLLKIKLDDVDKYHYVIETPQYMFLRVAIQIHIKNLIGPDCTVNNSSLRDVIDTYRLMSNKHYIHATPTLFNSGTSKAQMSSCFLLSMQNDSIVGIYDTLKQCAIISKHTGGIGVSISNIRAKGSPINGTGGVSSGIVPMLKVFSDTARYVDQGGGKRKGVIAAYLEPWHADVYDFIDLRKNHGVEELRARDIFLGLYVNDIFMKRVENDEHWTLFCPYYAPQLIDLYGDKFNLIYQQLEADAAIPKRVVKARHLWFAILDSQIETGNPYLVYKDACNLKSNQKNLGTIRCSNLCCEIVEYSSNDQVAVCNLASLGLPSFVINGSFDFKLMMTVVSKVVTNLDKLIDVNYYPLDETYKSNNENRPMGIGVQGLADVFMLLNMPFDSDEARSLNIAIFEAIYYSALKQSNILAADLHPYTSYKGSPVSMGILQMDMWAENTFKSKHGVISKEMWNDLRIDIKMNGVRHSLLISPMPTASTSRILGYNECIEPCTSNVYKRRVLNGDFVVFNKHLRAELQKYGLWSDQMYAKILADDGSVQNIDNVPKHIKKVYKTVWELKMKTLIDMAADRGRYVDQSQSLNLFVTKPTYSLLSSMHLYAWKQGLKTGMYYLRTRASAEARSVFETLTDKLSVVDINPVIIDNDENACSSCSA